MTTQTASDKSPATKVQRKRTPIWRRATSLVSLGSLVLLVGVAIAAVVGAAALLMFVLLEQAVG